MESFGCIRSKNFGFRKITKILRNKWGPQRIFCPLSHIEELCQRFCPSFVSGTKSWSGGAFWTHARRRKNLTPMNRLNFPPGRPYFNSETPHAWNTQIYRKIMIWFLAFDLLIPHLYRHRIRNHFRQPVNQSSIAWRKLGKLVRLS